MPPILNEPDDLECQPEPTPLEEPPKEEQQDEDED